MEISSPFVIPMVALALVFGGWCFFKSAGRWAAGLHLLLLAVIFGGIVGVNLGSGAYPILFRDVFIVLPLYIGFFLKKAGQEALAHLPGDVLLVLLLLFAALFVGSLNSTEVTIGEIVIGLKVWLFYIPFLVVGIALASRPDRMIGFFRQVLVWGTIACAIGLAQSLLVRVVGYDRVIGWFFGARASQVTQGFAFFHRAGGIYRIPGTFSFVTQYSNFLYVYLTIAMIEMNFDPDRRMRTWARNAIFLALVAGILCGARSAILTFPATLAAYVLCGLLNARILFFAPVAVVMGGAILAYSGIDLVQYFGFGLDLASHYGQDFIFQQVAEAVSQGFLGAGIGSSTIAARYAAGGSTQFAGAQLGFESYFGKSAAEIGWLGLVVIVVLLATFMVHAFVVFLKNRPRRENAATAPLAIYIAFIVVTSLKGSPLDEDPGNIFFWLFLGILVGIDRFRQRQSVKNHAPHPESVAPSFSGVAPGT